MTRPIGQSSEAGLHEWMPFVIFHAGSHKRSQRHIWADFWVGVASHCVEQWKLNLEFRSSTKDTTVAVAKITGERGCRVEKKCLCTIFVADQKIVSSSKKLVLGHLIAQATSYCLLPDAFFWLRASKNVFKVGSVKFTNLLSPPSVVKKVCTGSKSSQGT